MKLKNVNDISPEEVTAFGSTGTTVQWIWGKDDGVPNFYLRRFVISPGNHIGLHDHTEEHEIYILSGEGMVFDGTGHEVYIRQGNTLFVSPDEPHGYKNTGTSDLVFLCIIPRLHKDNE
jgi:quercetin dioxygenase-like cupin family protein